MPDIQAKPAPCHWLQAPCEDEYLQAKLRFDLRPQVIEFAVIDRLELIALLLRGDQPA